MEKVYLVVKTRGTKESMRVEVDNVEYDKQTRQLIYTPLVDSQHVSGEFSNEVIHLDDVQWFHIGTEVHFPGRPAKKARKKSAKVQDTVLP